MIICILRPCVHHACGLCVYVRNSRGISDFLLWRLIPSVILKLDFKFYKLLLRIPMFLINIRCVVENVRKAQLRSSFLCMM